MDSANDDLQVPLLITHEENDAANSIQTSSSAPRGLFSNLFFGWVSPLVEHGAAHHLQAKDLLNPDAQLQPGTCGRELLSAWFVEVQRARHAAHEQPSLLRVMAATYGREYLWLGFLKLVNDLNSFSGPLLLKLLVDWLGTPHTIDGSPPPPPSPHPPGRLQQLQPGRQAVASSGSVDDAYNLASSSGLTTSWTEPQWWLHLLWSCGPQGPFWGFTCAALLALSACGKALLNAHFNWHLGRLQCRLRAGLMCVLYQKALVVRHDGHEEDAGADAAAAADAVGAAAADVDGRVVVDVEGGCSVAATVTTASAAKLPKAAAAAAATDEAADATAGKAAASVAAAAAPAPVGEVSTLVSVDAGRIVNLFLSLHELWSLPAQILLALFLLYTQVRFAFLAGLAVTLVLIPINRWISVRILAASTDMMTHKDERIRLTGELLRGIRAIKMLAWEGVFARKIEAARRLELKGLAIRKYLDALCVYFWAATSLLFGALTFGLMALLGIPLTPSAAFTSMALFQVLIAPLNAFPWVVNGVLEALVSVRRVQGYLQLPQHRIDGKSAASSAAAAGVADSQQPAAVFQSASYAWSQDGHPCLEDLSLTIPAGGLTVVVGAVGSGKSCLLAALLGELQPIRGSCKVLKPVAGACFGYAPQSPWIMSGTIRENVLLGSPMDERLYWQVLEACALLPDLEQLPGRDLALTGDRGSSLSGGQRARVALARALYHRHAHIYLLDDVLAAVDNRSAAHITDAALLGPLLVGRTVVLCSKSPRCINAAQLVVHLHAGKAVFAGSPADYWQHMQLWQQQHGHKQRQQQQEGQEGQEGQEEQEGDLDAIPGDEQQQQGEESGAPDEPAAAGSASSSAAASSSNQRSKANQVQQARDAQIVDQASQGEEEREVGHVRWGVYVHYISAVGWCTAAFVILSLLAMQASKSANDLWVSSWVARVQAAAAASGAGARGYSLAELGSWQQLPAVAAGPAAVAAAGAESNHSISSTMLQSLAAWCGGARPAAGWSAGMDPAACSGSSSDIGGSSNGTSLPLLHALASLHASSSGQEQPGQPRQQPLPGSQHAAWFSAPAAAAAGAWLRQQHLSCSAAGAAAATASGSAGNSQLLQQRLDAAGVDAADAAAAPVTADAADYLSSSLRVSAAKHHPPPPPQHKPRPPAPSPDPTSPEGIRLFLHGLLAISLINCGCTLARAFSFAYAGLSAARRSHRTMLHRVLKCPMWFFDRVPVGRIINRFASDISKVDDSLPFIMNIFLAQTVSLLGLLAVMCYSSPALLLLLLPMAVVYRRLQVYYRCTSRELRRLESVALSPVFSAFADVAEAGTSVRAYGAGAHFMGAHAGRVTAFQRATVSGSAAGVWLGVRLQLMASVLVTSVAVLATLTHLDLIPGLDRGASTTASLAGLSLAYALPILGVLDGLLSSSAETEQEMVAVERVMQYLKLPQQRDVLPVLPVIAPGTGGLTLSTFANDDADEDQEQQQQQPLQGVAPGAAAAAGNGAGGLLGWLRVRTTGSQQQQGAAGNNNPTSPSSPSEGASIGLGLEHIGSTLLPAAPPAQSSPSRAQMQRRSLTPAPSPAKGPHFTPATNRTACTAAGTAGLPAVLELREVYMRYNGSTSHALAGCSMAVAAGEKLGVCGRTGAGKSSMIAVMMRLVEIESGCVLLRGEDVRTLPLSKLRSSFGVVPQAPFIFRGTIRDNLDPHGRLSHFELCEALRSVRLWDALVVAARKARDDAGAATAADAGTVSGGAAAGSGGLTASSAVAGAVAPATSAAVPVPKQAPNGASAASEASSAANSVSSNYVSMADLIRCQQQQQQRQPRRSVPGVAAAAAVAAALSQPQAVLRAAVHQRQQRQRRSSWEELMAEPLLAKHEHADRQQPNQGLDCQQQHDAELAQLGARVLSLQLGGPAAASAASGADATAGEDATAAPRHVGLSAGQQQLLCLARMLLQRRSIVLLDECTANVDPITASIMRQVMGEQLEGCTVIQVAHDLSAITDYDRVVVMEGGAVAEAGRPQQLLRRQGLFAAMASAAVAAGATHA